MSHTNEQLDSRLTVPQFVAAATGRKLTVVTAYDATSAAIVDAAGVDAVLVGDSLANVVQGRATTLSVTLREMVYHATMVMRAVRRALVVVDLPFPYAQLGEKAAVRAAATILKKSGADAVKIEGGRGRANTIAAVVNAGIPVMGHCGLMPQDVKRLGRFSVQRDHDTLLADTAAIEDAGAFAVVLECVGASIASDVTSRSGIPTIGIGAGRGCDGQVLVFHDLVGYSEPSQRGPSPRHARRFTDVGVAMRDAVAQYVVEVQSGAFPNDEESF
ncbi:MAG: 3-methyl-2-oxobutanoate hydroxymethyltransferase [Thermoguttaceae bacterium]